MHLAPRMTAIATLCSLGLLASCTNSATTPEQSQATAPTPQSRPASSTPPRPRGKPDLTSNLQIPPNECFVFAGGQDDGYTTVVTNRGQVPVRILSELDSVSTPIVTIEPGQQASHRFSSKAAALFENPSTSEARLLVEVWGETDVGMRYRPMMAPVSP